METQGRVQNGVVVFDGPPKLPEGAIVTVIFPSTNAAAPPPKRQATFPLVPSDKPGSLQLSGDQVAEFLNDEDLSARH
jgi:hypothetical protein